MKMTGIAFATLYSTGYLALYLSGILYNNTSIGFSQILPYFAKSGNWSVNYTYREVHLVSSVMTVHYPVIILESGTRNLLGWSCDLVGHV